MRSKEFELFGKLFNIDSGKDSDVKPPISNFF